MLLKSFVCRLLFTGLLLFATVQLTFAQTIDPSKVDVNALSDNQVIALISEMEKRGLSENEAIALAQARGMSQSQINDLKRRISEVKSGTRSGTKKEHQGAKEGEAAEQISSKAPIDSVTTRVNRRIFGFEFFNSEKLTFEPNVNIPVSPSYVLGAGDEVLVDIWGASQKSYQLKIDRNGMVIIPEIGPLSIGGLTLANAQQRILQKLPLIYSDLTSASPRTFASVYMGELKAIKVNVIGEVFVPGTYTLPGTSTVFNALYLSGGPNESGSFRDIQVIRDGKVIGRLDVYDFLLNGNGSVNISLRDNDVVLVPTYIHRVKMGGNFKRSGWFEAKSNETVGDAIRYAGGFKEDAYSGRVELYRNTSKQRQFLNVTEFDFDKISLQSGDSIFVGEIIQRFENRVSVEGAVFRPGNFEMKEGLTLSQLIEQADGVREDAFTQRGLVVRLNKDLSLQNIAFSVVDLLNGNFDIPLQREDRVVISSINEMREFQVVSIVGEVQRPGEFDYRERMTLSDLIFMAGGLKESASESSIEISRRLNYDEADNFTNKTANLYQFKVLRSLELVDESARFVLQPYDQVYIRRSPSYSENGTVRVSGEVKYAGDYSLKSKNERLTEIIFRSGGLSPDAYLEGAMLTRRVNITPKMKRLREELKKRDSTLVFNDVEFDVIGVNLVKAMGNPGSRNDIFMRSGDELFIPRENQTVKVSGEVLNPISLTYQKDKGLKRYVNQGGGFGNKAKKNRVYVIHPNGEASTTRNFLFIRSYPDVTPGSEIIVPQKPEREPMSAGTWISISSSLASLTLAVVSIVNLTK
jgi:protein involved in polysaccharide export with SLBB domain